MELTEQNLESQLIRQCIKGERSAFQKLYNQNAAWMFAICMRYHKNQEDAEDVLQESFIQVYRNLQSYKFEGNFKGWLRKITVNCALAKFRLHKIETISFNQKNTNHDFSALDTTLLDDLDAQELIYYINQLSDGRRQVFLAYAVDGFKHNEIAELLGISEGTSKSQLFDARKELMQAISKKHEYVNLIANEKR